MADETIKPFRPLGNYDWPSTPVNRNIDRIKSLLKKRLFRSKNNGGIDLERLQPAEEHLLDKVAAPPANKPLIEELDFTLEDWISEENPKQPIKTLIFPPCDRENFLRSWAGEKEYPILELDDFERKISNAPDKISDLFDQDILVIPRLEDWFRRSETHLASVRLLLSALETPPQKIIIGCNSWAWQFLRKACEIDAVCIDPLTFQAFDTKRLGRWLESLSEGITDASLNFKSAKSGGDAFDFKPGSEQHNDYMSDLANKSLGIPWVAWNIWRASLQTDSDKEPPIKDATMSESAVETLWITELRDFALPNRHDQNALLVLQTLLIHNGLSRADIELTVPTSQYTNVIPSLIHSGMVDKIEDIYHCVPAAYPAIRDGLRSAGFPTDIL